MACKVPLLNRQQMQDNAITAYFRANLARNPSVLEPLNGTLNNEAKIDAHQGGLLFASPCQR